LRFPGRLICQPVRAGARVSDGPSEAFLHFAASIANRTFHTVLIKMILRLRLQEEPDGVKKVPRALFDRYSTPRHTHLHDLAVSHIDQRTPHACRPCICPNVRRVRSLALALTAYGLCAWAR
jgi:hypothetical protein